MATSRSQPRSHTKVALKSLAAAVFMFGFGYAMVPLYDIICDITGLNGKTGRVSAAVALEQSNDAKADRQVIVEFTASINASGSWVFEPAQKTMTVTPGQTYQTS